jgi:hypothetical protein
MNQTYFLFPFATDGDLTEIPAGTQGSGVVSYQQGFGSLYSENPLTVGTALEIDRAMFNGILYDITTNLQNYQQFGCPEWITSANNNGTSFSYGIGAMVRYSANGVAPFVTYISLVQGNTATPAEGANWSQVASFNKVAVETTRAEAAEAVLQTNITAETARATGAEGALGTRITGETTRAEGQENVIYTYAQSVETNLIAETVRAENAEAALNPGRYLGIYVAQATPGSYTFTVPVGVYFIKVYLVGGGGGGSDCANGSTVTGASDQSGGGGGGGAYAGVEFAVSPGQVYGYAVGAGGAAQGTGGASAINTPSGQNAVANGGAGASFQSTGFSSGGAGGTCTGPVSFYHGGADGSDGQANQYIFAGNGGASGWGSGGGRAGYTGGVSGKPYGGGGGGAYCDVANSTLYTGGVGYSGVVFILSFTGQ